MNVRANGILFSICLAVLIAACGGGSGGKNPPPQPEQPGAPAEPDKPGDGEKPQARTFLIEPGPDATHRALEAFIAARPGDTIQFAKGFFELTTGLIMQNTEGVTIRGMGRDETVLSFRNSDTAEGMLITNVPGIVIEGLTVIDTPGDGVKVKGSNHVTYRNMRAMWSSDGVLAGPDNYQSVIQVDCPADPRAPHAYTPSPQNGRYGVYPVESRNVLVEGVEVVGASDAGIYVGQSEDVIVRDSRAAYNVAGFEIENTDRADMYGNLAECNTGGYLVFDLPNLSLYGDGTRVFDNVARNNNIDNFAAAGIVGAVPPGTGMLILGYDRVEVFGNEIRDHNTGSILVVSHEMIEVPEDRRLDLYAEGVHIHDNIMINGGGNPPLPDIESLLQGDLTSAMPTLVRLKNRGYGAHIVWDGLFDDLAADCAYPVDAAGEPVPADEYGEPQYRGSDPNPDCRYNAYKFDPRGERLKPSMWLCIENNQFSQENPLVANFVNFHGMRGLELLDLLFDPSLMTWQGLLNVLNGLPGWVGSNNLKPHQCSAQYGETLPRLAAVEIEPYVPGEGGFEPPTEEEILAACERDTGSAVNREALQAYDCPLLSHYNLFADSEDPRSMPNDGGVPFVLNSKLFSDYSVKYRVAFLPPGEAAQFRDAADGVNQAIEFPVGTVIAKTFAFPDERTGSENVVETRLLIKRRNPEGAVRWDGLPYIWETTEDGQRVARLALGGGTAAVAWHYRDPATGRLYQGSTENYAIPHANQCVTCHAGDDRPTGAPPIGPKPRNLNRAYAPEALLGTHTAQGQFPQVNQIAYWREHSLLVGGPDDLGVDPNTGIAANVERLPRFNVAGDAGHLGGTPEDIEARARAYLEINCAYCHNPNGNASNTGLFLDSLREVNVNYGICKTPVAAGSGSGGREHDIVPGDADASIMPYRMASLDPEAKMPPLARSVADQEGVSLVQQWIDTVVDGSYADAGCEGRARWPWW